jgi:predicted nucleic acid-binding protein
MRASFLDSNIILYTLDTDDHKQDIALKLLAEGCFISTQVLSEVANVMLRKLGYGIEETRATLQQLNSTCHVHVVQAKTISLALDVRQRYGFSYFDSLIVSAAQEAGCERLYTEDLQDGQLLDSGLKIANPFFTSTATSSA